MRVSLAVLLTAIFGAMRPVSAQVTVDDLMKLKVVSDVRISPNGEQIAYVVSTPTMETASHEGVLYRISSKGGTPQRLTYETRIFNKPIVSPNLRWSPDGTRLSFVAWVEGVPQVVAMAADGGETWQVTSVKGGVARYEVSPDGKYIAFSASDPLPAADEEAQKKKTYVEHVDQNLRPPRVWVQEFSGGTPKALSPNSVAVVDFHWAPDSKSVIYSASDDFGFSAQYKSTIYSVGIDGGETKTLMKRPGMNRLAQYSPDGKWIAFISSGGKEGMMNAMDLYMMAADGSGTPRGLTLQRQMWVSEFFWAPDGKSIFLIPDEQTNDSGEHMFEQSIFRVGVADGKIELVNPGRTANFSATISNDGKRIAYRSVESRAMGDVVMMDLASHQAQKLTDINPQLHSWKMGDLEPVSWKSFDGKQIWGLLLTPPGYTKGKRIPLVVYCHGGPIGGYTYGIFPQFAHIPGQVDPYPDEAMASAGMAILFPMPRGGSGYGVEGFKAIINRWGEDDYKDIMAGVDAMVAEGIADPDRLGVMGASYGGFMTSWIVTQTGRFKAASTGASVTDLVSEYYLSDGGDFMVEYYNYPWIDDKALVEHSPITHVKNVTTPLLIQHGESDFRVPVSQAREFYKALKVQHKTVEFDIYPRGGHVNFEPTLERAYMRRNLEWFEKWLKPEGNSAEERGSQERAK
jgi:dipeptidyl aminopeptidase/acylaminoacyl peptidase